MIAGCGRKEANAGAPPAAVSVKSIVAANETIPDTGEYLATLKSRHSTSINPQVEGQITQIFVKSGDRVEAGAALLQIDPLKQQATVGSQEASRAAQVANVAYAKQQLERAQQLFAAGVIAKQELDQSQTAYDTAQEQLKSLDAQVREQQVQLRYYSVVAPTSGIVGDIPVRVGDRVTVSTLLTTVDEPGRLEAYVAVPVEDSKKLRMGMSVQLVDALGNSIGDTAVDFISPRAAADTQSVLVKATISNPKDALRTAQFARARILWGTHQGPLVPVLAVSRINGQYFAFLVENSGKSSVARQRMVRVGELIGNRYTVLEGIKAGDHIVVEGTQDLGDGTAVSETLVSSGTGTP